jgi:hypothetical protein
MTREDERMDAVGDRGAPTPSQAQAGTRQSLDALLARLLGRRAFIALQLGASLVATVAGLVVYLFLTSLHLVTIVALALGFLFALLVRQAARYLALEWLLRQTRERTPPSPPPSM